MEGTAMRKTLATFLVLALASCGEDRGPGIPKEVTSIIFLQRSIRNEGGNVFDYLGYQAGSRIVKLEPPAADGKLTVLTSDPMWTGADFMAWDLSFDASTIVFSARLANEDRYQIFTMNVDGTNPKQLTDGPRDHVYPIFIPGQKILFYTNDVVEPTAQQFRDEYERATTAQVGIMNQDGTALTLGPRNVSHRVSPALLPDGRVLYTEWLHLGGVNDGHLRLMNSDMTGQREAFGGEGDGITNSYLKGRYVATRTTADGKTDYRIVTIGTSRDRTLQSGKLLLVDLNASERTATYKDMTPLVPGDRGPSQIGVGRYYDAEILPPNPSDLLFLVSWADGPVESEVLTQAKTNADFGIYLFDGKTGLRYPIYNDPKYWDVLARPVMQRPEPPITSSPISGTQFVVGALDVRNSSIFSQLAGTTPGVDIFKVRLMEGFSTEEGFPDMFGTTEFDGHSRYGEVPIYQDGSFAAVVPANVPVHMQVLDKFAMSMASEPVWISGRPGEQRFCGGCHEDRAKATQIQPGTTEAVQRGATNLDVPRDQRISLDYSYAAIRGVPWDLALQPIFDAHCVSCHNGVPGPANPSYTVTDLTTGTMQTFVFDLRGQKINITVGERMTGDFTASYISLSGLGMELGEDVVQITGNYKSYINPGSARDSDVIKMLNPPQRFPTLDPSVRGFQNAIHPADVGGTEIAPDDYYKLILNIDMGGQFFFRENRPGRL